MIDFQHDKRVDSKMAIVIPAFNEEITIKEVIFDFHKEFPQADIVVVDNNSKDHTKQIVLDLIDSGEIKLHYLYEEIQGKGAAVRAAFRSIRSQNFVMVDGDGTYHAHDLHRMLDIYESSSADMLVGDRISSGGYKRENKRKFHEFGNTIVKKLINFYFNSNLNDVMSGYRIFSAKFIKNYAIIYDGFELETDLTIHALDKKLKIIEHPIQYTDRPIGSFSKLSTFKDGMRVILAIFNLIRHYKPMSFFGFFSLIVVLFALILGSFPIVEFIQTGYVSRIPLAILASSMVLLSFQLFVAGLVLDSISRGQRIAFEKQWNT